MERGEEREDLAKASEEALEDVERWLIELMMDLLKRLARTFIFLPTRPKPAHGTHLQNRRLRDGGGKPRAEFICRTISGGLEDTTRLIPEGGFGGAAGGRSTTNQRTAGCV